MSSIVSRVSLCVCVCVCVGVCVCVCLCPITFCVGSGPLELDDVLASSIIFSLYFTQHEVEIDGLSTNSIENMGLFIPRITFILMWYQ